MFSDNVGTITRDLRAIACLAVAITSNQKQKTENCLKLSMYIECGDATIHDAVISR